MKKLSLLLCALVGFSPFVSAAKADRGDEYQDDEGSRYGRRYSREYDRRDYDEHDHRARSSRQVYIVENGCAVRRVVYFDNYGRCFYPAGSRRVFVNRYYTGYPRFEGRREDYRHRHHGRRPHFSASFGF